MSGPSKPAFSMFGQQNTSNQGNTGGNLFGGASPFAGTPTSQAGGSIAGMGQTSIFGNAQPSGNEQSSPFGTTLAQQQNQAGSQQGPKSASNIFGGFSTPSRPSENTAPSLFGSSTGSATPNAKPAMFGSTTPAGPPPNAGATSLFGAMGGTRASNGGLFGAMSNSERPSMPAVATSSSEKPALFSGSSAPTTQSSGPPLFNATAKTVNPTLGSQATQQQGASVFSGNTASASNSSGQGQPSLFGTAPKSTSNLANAAPLSNEAEQTSAPSERQKPIFAFPTASPSSQEPGKDAGPTDRQAAKPTTQTTTHEGNAASSSILGQAVSSAAAPSSLFPQAGSASNVGSAAAQNAGANRMTSGDAQSTSSKANTSGSLFSSSATKVPLEAQTDSSQTGLNVKNNSINLNSSFAGPAPSAQSRLKNKSMEEIILRWATDLSKYQKEFQAQAASVASWDRMLVENSNAISKLYSKTFQAERDTAEVQRQLSAVEDQQDELTRWLDYYEREVDQIISRQTGQGETLQGPDQDRERTYQTAEKVSDRLSEMGTELTTMIEEINSASSAIGKTSKQDDPLSQIVRVLNGHLSQLQMIDQGTSELQSKLTATQKDGQRLSTKSRVGLGTSSAAADDFYRSYMSRR
ncbi:MAG: FG-nucleoporin nsp1 [Chrysothrix sp. TS-e1954]|nr:MAG: FG-nucleoporin nsp1 [Chrysothrix sp. TS-e1954]